VTFSTWAAAEQCIEALNGQFTFPGATQHIMVKLADAKPQDMQRVGAKRGMMDMGPGAHECKGGVWVWRGVRCFGAAFVGGEGPVGCTEGRGSVMPGLGAGFGLCKATVAKEPMQQNSAALRLGVGRQVGHDGHGARCACAWGWGEIGLVWWGGAGVGIEWGGRFCQRCKCQRMM
jgi:hypothetical protein